MRSQNRQLYLIFKQLQITPNNSNMGQRQQNYNNPPRQETNNQPHQDQSQAEANKYNNTNDRGSGIGRVRG